MKHLLKSLLCCALIFATKIYGYNYQSIEFYNEGSEVCCSSYNTYAGLYLGANIGYNWYNFRLHTPPSLDLPPLNKPRWRPRDWVPLIAVGYDFFPKRKIPLRLELNEVYEDKNFTQDPLFLPPFEEDRLSNNTFRFYNTMLTLFFDWHTCTRFVPYIGASGGYVVLKTEEAPRRRLQPPTNFDFSHTSHSFSYGGTVGARFFFTNHFVGNLQLRFNDLKEMIFVNKEDLSLSNHREFSSDYLHERTLLAGIAYVF
ncbi:MAG: hypothetical protein H0U71_03580 [Gammaproteobacteria bacterium]|nr:hypothetical protein [Gammaproteobacteria bacterium]